MSCIVLAISYNSSAVSKYFLSLAQELCARGHRLILLVGDQNKEVVAPDENPAVLTWPSKRPTHLKDALFLHRVIKKYGPDCVIGNFAAVNLCLLVSWLNSVPHRWAWYHTMSTAIDAEARLPRRKINLLRLRKRIIYQLASKVISVSGAAALDAMKVYGLKPDKVSLVLPCLLPNLEITNELVDPNLIVCVGRLVKSKGQETLIRAAKIILQRNDKVRFEFIGDGPDKEYFLNLAVSLGISVNCLFTGNIPQKEVLQKMASAWVSVVPSYSEALGMVNIESLSVGTPVVASNVDGIREIIIDNKTGFLVPPRNHEVLAHKIQNILEDRFLRESFSKVGRQHFLEKFSYSSLPRQADQIEKMLGYRLNSDGT